jgi:hypothetical protein
MPEEPAAKTVAQRAEVNHMQKSETRRLNEWRKDEWNATHKSLDPEDQSLWRMTKRVIRFPTPSPPLVTLGGIAVSDSEKAEALDGSLKTQFQPVTFPSVSAIIEMVDVALRSCFLTHANELKFSNPDEFQEANRGLKFGKAQGPNSIPNRALKHLLQQALSFFAQIFNVVLRTCNFPTVWKRGRVTPVFKPGKDSALPSS